MSARSRSVIRLVRLDDTEPDQAVRAGRSNRPGLAVLDAGEATRRREANGPGQAELQRENASIWWEIFAFFMEGFALYGAALHPTAAVPVHAILVAERDWRWQENDRAPPQPVRGGACEAGESDGNVVKLDHRFAAPPAHRWSWLHSLGETWAALWSHLRREREIRQAVAALMELDDRTLRDLGIDGRSDVELMVRYCRDC